MVVMAAAVVSVSVWLLGAILRRLLAASVGGTVVASMITARKSASVGPWASAPQ